MADTPTITQTPTGTTVNGVTYANNGNSDSATPNAPASSPSVTSSPSRSTFAQNGNKLQTYISQLGGSPTSNNPNPDDTDATEEASDPILKQLTALQSSSDAATKSLIASTMAAYQNKVNATTKQYENYKSGLQQLGVETNEAQSSPDLLAGHIQQAASDELSKINDYKAQEAQAVIKAQQAKADNDFKTLDEQMSRLKDIQTAKTDAIANMYKTLSSTSKAAAIEAHDIYANFVTLDPADQNAYIQAVSQKYGFNPNDLVTALNDERVKQAKTAKSLSTASSKDTNQLKFTSTQKNSLVNSGLPANQLNSIETYVNNYGVDAFISANPSLTDEQKTALQGLFAPKAKSTTFGGNGD